MILDSTIERIPNDDRAGAACKVEVVGSNSPAHVRARELDHFTERESTPHTEEPAVSDPLASSQNGHRTTLRHGTTDECSSDAPGGDRNENQPAQVPVDGHQFTTRAGIGPSGPATGGKAAELSKSSQCRSAHVEISDGAHGVTRPTTEEPFKSSDEARVKEANRRLELVQTYRALLDQGHRGKKAAELMGEDHVSLWRYNKAFEASGYNGLLPATDKCGRKSELQKLRELLGAELLDSILNEIKAINLDTESTTSALRIYATTDRCPEHLSRIILDPNRCSKHAVPASIRDAVAVGSSLRLAHRGPRALALQGTYTPRRCNDILPGDIFTSDDTTPIWAWWVPWVESEEYPFGVKLLQGQFLPMQDYRSQMIVSYALIAREKSSYRASDIWGLFGHTFDTIGLPRLGFHLERGSWEANIIRGQEIDYREDEVTMSRRVGGLRQLPTNVTPWHLGRASAAAAPSEVERQLNPTNPMAHFPKTLQTWTSYLPKSKSIEGWFNRNQTLEGTLWGSLGRNQQRAPFEKTKKLYEECKRPGAKRDPRNHFLSGTELAARLNKIIDYINHEPMEGEVWHGVPQLHWENGVREFPLYFCDEDKRYLYRREWRTLQITRGMARVRLSDSIEGKRYSLFYQNPEVFAGIEGEEVVIYYDRERFEEPAQIHRARDGQFLCHAEYQDRVGSFLDGDLSGHDIRRRWRNAVTTIYGTLAKHAPSRQLPAEIAGRRGAHAPSRVDSSADAGISGPEPLDGASNGTREGACAPQIEVRSSKPEIVPTRRSPFSPPKPEEIIKRRSRLEEEAEMARQLRAEVEN